MKSLLFVDDEKNILSFLTDLFSEQYKVYTVNNGFKALDIIEKNSPDIVFLDIIMPEIDGLETLKLIKQKFPGQLVIMLSSVGAINAAVKAVKLGAFDYICKPFEIKDIREIIDRAFNTITNKSKFRLVNDNDYELIGNNIEIRNIIEIVHKIAKKNVTVLLQGETGTGKEIVAQMIHNLSHRNKNNFVSIDCSAIPNTLIESELFGYERGAFTGAVTKKLGRFEMANNGTLFLDEIANLPFDMQNKLLRALQEGEIIRLGAERPQKIDVRLITAMHINLDEAVRANKFREDLYYRLNVVRIELPPLRKRLDDIPILLDYFIAKFEKKFKLNNIKYSDDLIEHLQKYHWPGNVRELQNAIERAIVFSDNTGVLTKDLFVFDNILPITEDFYNTIDIKNLSLKDAQSEFEKKYIIKILEECNGNRKLAADRLKIDRTYLSKLITKYDIKI